VAAAHRVVIKVGSTTLQGPYGGLDYAYVASLIDQIVAVRKSGAQVVLVSSGAIAAGLDVLGITERPTDMPTLQAAASVGQVRLVETYGRFLGERGVRIGQVLLTRHDTGHRESFLHARDTFDRLLALGALPVVNENDTVAVDEIRFGDNDTLAALVATMIGADLVVVLSDIEGLYDADPRLSEEATLLSQVDELTDDLVAAAGGSGSDAGSGGMATKVDAAKVLMKAGIPLVVCNGRREGVIVDAVAGEPVGTMFDGGEGSLTAHKMWIALGRKAAGEIVLDDGAREAIVSRNKSLLPAGVVGVVGTFQAGDAVVLKDRAGAVLARGLSGLSSADLDAVKGLRKAEIEQVRPDVAGKVVVHRDRLAIL